MKNCQQFFTISAFFAVIIGILMFILITETAEYLIICGISQWKSYLIAGIFEITAICLIEYLMLSTFKETESKWDSFKSWSFRAIAIIILFLIFAGIIIATGIRSAKPHLTGSRFRTEDELKLKAYNDSVESAKKNLESVKGQKVRTGAASGVLNDVLTAKHKFLESMKPDTVLETVGNTNAVIMIAIRFLLQSLSWIMSGILGSLIRSNLEQSKDEPEPENKKPEKLPVPVNVSAQSFDNSRTAYKIENPVIGTEIVCQQEKEISKGVQLIHDCKSAIKPQEAVKAIYPEAKCVAEGLNGNKIFNIVIPSGEVIGSAKNASLAWVDARRGLI